jgi:WD40 repeat protein
VAADRSFHGIYVHGVAFHPTNTDEIATGTWKTNLATIWDVGSGEQKRAIHVGNPVNVIVYSPDGRQLATAGTNGQIHLWNSASGARQDGGGMRHGRKPVHELAFATEGHLLVSASDDETAAIWNLRTEKKVRSFKHRDKVLDVAFRGDGKRIATACADGRWYIYPTSEEDLISLAKKRLEQISDH